MDHEEWNEEEDTSSGSEKEHSQPAKAASPAQDTQGENKNEDAR